LEIALALHNVGAVATFALGCLGLGWPRTAAAWVGVEPVGSLGLSELRATYGGLFAALGAFAFLAQDAVVFTGLGAAWLGAAGGRLTAAVLDRAREPRVFAAALAEGALGVLLLAPA
jgi:hypothetical protein